MPAHRHRLAVLVGLPLLAGCYPITGNDRICTAHIQPGLFVRVTHAVTGEPLASGATVVARDGGYQETLVRAGTIRIGDANVVVTKIGVDERPGIYSVEVSHPGYASVVVTGVRVTANECHVIPREVDVRLSPL